MKFTVKFVAVCAAVVCAGAAYAQKGETVKIAFIDPLSAGNLLLIVLAALRTQLASSLKSRVLITKAHHKRV
jgi:hypothetical protein